MFVVPFWVCGGWLGLMSEALKRWRFGECLGGFWEAVVDWSDGNCERIRLGLQLGSGGVLEQF